MLHLTKNNCRRFLFFWACVAPAASSKKEKMVGQLYVSNLFIFIYLF